MKNLKRMLAAVAAGAVLAGTAPEAPAADRGINGLILGAGGGALLGQAIGRDTEGTLIGTAVGGVLGYMVGNEMDKQSMAPAAVRPAETVIIERERPRPAEYRYYEQHYRRGPECRDAEILAMVGGRPQVVVTTACREDGEWVVRDASQRRVTRVVLVESSRHGHSGGPPPGRGWRKESWREVRWR